MQFSFFSSVPDRRLLATSLKRFALTVALAAAAENLHAADPLQTWHVRTAPTDVHLKGVAFGADRFVAVGADGVIASSPDGVTWGLETSLSTADLSDIVYANGLFVAIGRSRQLLTSPDGKQWTKQDYKLGGGPIKVIHDGQRFVLVQAGGPIAVSANGLEWSPNQGVPVNYDVGGIAYGNGVYVEVGYKRTGKPPDAFSSPDLLEWTQRDSHATENLVGVGFGLGLFVGTGQDGTLITSPDGITWTARESQTTGFIWDVASDGNHLVACSQWGRLLVSANGLDWVRYETEVSGHLQGITFGRQTFVAVGWSGAIVQSDPVAGTPVRDTFRLIEPAWSGGSFSFKFSGTLGESYGVQSSSDGVDWAPVANVVCDSTPMTYSDVAATPVHRFYRLVRL